MFTHAQIWQGIDHLAKNFGYSASGLAKQAGLDPTSFNKSKRLSPDGKPRWPSTESIAKILDVTGASMEDFVALINADQNDLPDFRNIAHETAKILLDTKSVLFNVKEPFTYTSGRIGPVYVDTRRLISFPKERTILMNFGAAMLKDLDIDYVAGGETAGIPYGAFMAERLNKPMIYIRKKPKGVGRMAQIEGCLEGKKKKILLVEDVQNFGTSVNIFVEALRNAGTTIEHSFVLFNHGHKSVRKDMKELGLTVHALATWHDVLDVAKKGKYFDAKTLKSVEAYLKNPNSWQN